MVRVFTMSCDRYRLETRFRNPYSGNEKGSVRNAVRAMDDIVEDGRTPNEASPLALDRRIAQGNPPDVDDGSDRLAVYDAFNNLGGKRAES